MKKQRSMHRIDLSLHTGLLTYGDLADDKGDNSNREEWMAYLINSVGSQVI